MYFYTFMQEVWTVVVCLKSRICRITYNISACSLIGRVVLFGEVSFGKKTFKKKKHQITFILWVYTFIILFHDFNFFVLKNSGLLTVHNQAIFIIFQWFEHCEILDAETTANICKFRGDHKYYNKQYEEALLCYRQALGWFHQFN